MSTSSVIDYGNAKSRGAIGVTRSDQSGALQNAIALAFREVFPRKTWLEIAEWFGLSERGAKHRLAGSREFTADELALMLRSEHGLTFLSAVMADATPRWWVAFKQQVAMKDARRLEAAARRKLQEAIDAEADLSAAISHTDALLDQDFVRPHSDALRAMGRVRDRAVAAPAGRGQRR
jgi:hypothetical protein